MRLLASPYQIAKVHRQARRVERVDAQSGTPMKNADIRRVVPKRLTATTANQYTAT